MWKRLRYRFDNAVARRPRTLLLWHFIASAAVLSLFAAAAWMFDIYGTREHGMVRTMLLNIVLALDPGLAETVGTGALYQRAAALMVAIVGILIVGSLIPLLHNAIHYRIEYLRKGTSEILESDHVVILGWSPQVFSILQNLVSANSNRPRACIAILADMEKVDMEDAIRARMKSDRITRIVCRSGSTIDPHAVRIVRPSTARAVIIVSPDTTDPDSHVIKTLLALTADVGSGPSPHIVAQLDDARNREVAELAARGRAVFVNASEVIAHALVQSCQQSGMSSVLDDLLSFDGREVYFQTDSRLFGLPFSQALHAYSDASVIGFRTSAGGVRLNPAPDAVIGVGDQIIAIAEDDDRWTYAAAGPSVVDRSAIAMKGCHALAAERIIILGYNRRIGQILCELDSNSVAGTEVRIVCPVALTDDEIDRLAMPLTNIRLDVHIGDPTARRVLERLDIPYCDHVIVVARCDEAGIQEADAQTIMTLLQLRRLADPQDRRFTIATELLDSRNRELIETAHGDDFIVDDTIVSRMITPICENREVGLVFDTLFDSTGSEIYFRPACDYVVHDRDVTFHTVVESARMKGQIAIGYQHVMGPARSEARELVLNPDKSAPVRFGPHDRVVVLADQ